MIGEYEGAFYGSQYAAMAPLFDHYGIQLWIPSFRKARGGLSWAILVRKSLVAVDGFEGLAES